jgi:DNA-binding transcriptional LysR family regulator
MIDCSLRELEAFVAVAEELSFTRAAARLRLAQPPLSRHVRTLEGRLGTRLFERTNRKVSLTVPGRAFYAEVKEPLVRLDRAASAARRAAAGETARLELGFVSSLLGPELADLFRHFRAAHPDVQLTLQDRIPSEQLQAIVEGRLDGGFVGLAPRPPVAGVTFVPWRREALVLFVPRAHRWAGKARIPLRALAGEPLVAVAAAAAPAFASKIQELCRGAGFRPHIVQEASRAQAVVAMVAAGSGVAILPASVHRVTSDAVHALKLTAREALVTYVFAHRGRPGSAALLQFVAALTRPPPGRVPEG